MTGIEKVIYKPLSNDEERYSMTRKEVEYLYQRYSRTPFDLIWRAFRYGLEKGRRCERAKHKKAANAPTDQSEALTATDTTGNG
mgnify:CR=1 FL=1